MKLNFVDYEKASDSNDKRCFVDGDETMEYPDARKNYQLNKPHPSLHYVSTAI